MRRSALVGALPAVMLLALLQGCNKQQDCPKEATTVVEEVKVSAEESYECSSVEGADALKQTFCEARSEFDKSDQGDDVASFTPYLKGYRDGINDARQAEASKIGRDFVEGQKQKPYEAGYRAGYDSVMKKLGIIEYNCRDSEEASEYKDRWCEADDAYRVSGIGTSENPFLRGRYIDGYMAGGRVALTVPTSMEAFFNGDNPEGKQPAIFKREEVLETESAFYKGFDEGYKAMIASIRESINQVMQQMQVPNNMQMPEGLMPPQPGQ